MQWSWIWSRLTPGNAERDDTFRSEVLRLSHLGLRAMGSIQIVTAVLMLGAQLLIEIPLRAREHVSMSGRVAEAVLMIAMGAATLAVSRARWSYERSRLLVGLSGWLACALLIVSSLILTPHASGDDEYIPVQIATVMLVAITATPLRPLQTLSLGLSIGAVYLAASLVALNASVMEAARWDPSNIVFTIMLTLLATALSAVVYAERVSRHKEHADGVHIAEMLASAQSRALLSESAVSVGRLAAALTHELNTPLGALKSSIDTLLVLAAKQAVAPPEAQPRLVAVQADLRRGVANSIDRLQKVIARLQQFVDMDHTARTEIDLNELLGDVAILFEPRIKDKIRLEFQLRPLPRLYCRPQQLTTVFSSLLSNAIDAVNGDGRIVISTVSKDTQVEVRIEDNGRGMAPEILDTIFDPGFRVSSGRMSAGNWSLFSSRQIVFEHGGNIQITSAAGEGTTVVVTLPA
ncbi:MAG: HAMP domain-containing histidine kinase [Candidatus Solibacter usitatus]|nr:HAMP domain-containing histidine kinase [Candidatus Solibacter usitatus]